ncbi:hypothetical protein CPB86DRAFT_876672 [Serendipita vermifera]|nr:hypothetical protein CPB86DRAFT_876672 [Serendipita vermifera]
MNRPVPDYETMIVRTLEAIQAPEGVPPRDIFNYMMKNWPLIPNFRPSASQALARALKKGRLVKNASLYSLNSQWIEGQTSTAPDYSLQQLMNRSGVRTSQSAASRVKTQIPIQNTNGDAIVDEFSPDQKATAQAAASLLRVIADPVKEIINAPEQRRDEGTMEAAHGGVHPSAMERETRKSLLKSLEAIVSQMREIEHKEPSNS